jgi:hypothetical protein
MMNKRACLHFGLVAFSVLVTGAVRAGDDSYGADDHLTDEKGTIYYGFVRDDRGRLIADASVILRSKTGVSVTLTTNNVGLYRGQITKDVQPQDVEVLCEKAGYDAGSGTLRTTTPSNGRVEAPCALKRLPN